MFKKKFMFIFLTAVFALVTVAAKQIVSHNTALVFMPLSSFHGSYRCRYGGWDPGKTAAKRTE